MNILIACEESQRVCAAFREQGHAAYSCDIQDCSGGHPEWHIKGDVLRYLNPIFFNCEFADELADYAIPFRTQDGFAHCVDKWDMIIAHPPCTYLTHAAVQCHSLAKYSYAEVCKRTQKRLEAADFFMRIALADCEKIAIENPVGVMNTVYRKPDCIIHPWQFSNGPEDTENYVTKRTCLWLKGLPVLRPLCAIGPDNEQLYGRNPKNGNLLCWTTAVSTDRQKNRSKTFPAIAAAMAYQWG